MQTAAQCQSAVAKPGPAFSDPDEIRSHLRRLTGSPEFAGTPRLARFLSYIVETAVAGQTDRIKESLIAVEVYGRRPDYNPQIDSTVRVEAGRLRARLSQYYTSSGAGDRVRIHVPKGGYVPVFETISRDAVPAAEPEMPPVPPVPPNAPALRIPRRRLAVGGAFLGIVGIAFGLTRIRGGSEHLIDSVAVLPFVSLDSAPATDRFSDALTEEVTTALGRSSARPRVAGRSTMARYRQAPVDVRRVGKDHNVRAVVEGSVRRESGRVIVTAQLIDTTNGYQLWADRFESDAGDVAGAQSRFSARIVAGADHVFRAHAVHHSEPDQQTIELYHRAVDLLRIPVHKNGYPDKIPETVVESVRLFREVTRRSPEMGKGWAGLAEAAEWEYELRGNQPRERILEARAAAYKAVEVAPEQLDGWRILTSILLYREWDFKGAAAACRRAIELDPRDTSSRQRYIDILRAQGRTQEAWSEVEQAVRLQPASARLRARRALMLYESGKYREALAEAQAAGELTNQIPEYPMALWVQGLTLEQLGRLSEAERVFRSALTVQRHDPWSKPALGHLLGRSGGNRRAESEAILGDLQIELAHGRMAHVAQALVLTGLGRTDEALTALEQGFIQRDDAIPFISLDPRFWVLSAQPRFRAVVAKLATLSPS
jgi:TolB-like protein/tetratricopeptide (TPR) repeat protein